MRNHLQQLQRHPVALVRNHTEDGGLGSLSVLRCSDTPVFTAQLPAARPNGHCVQRSHPQVTETRGWPAAPLQPLSDPRAVPPPASLSSPPRRSKPSLAGVCRVLAGPVSCAALSARAAWSRGLRKALLGFRKSRRDSSPERGGPLAWCSTRNSEKRITVRPGGVRGRDVYSKELQGFSESVARDRESSR